MGFFFASDKAPEKKAHGYSKEFLHANGCKVCPLRQEHAKLQHPDMQPYGSERPDIYMLGEAPGATEDEEGQPFVGKAGQVLRFRLPSGVEKRMRWNNVVRTRPPKNRDPSDMEIECCRPSIVADIERTKPKAIFGFGNVPMRWAFGFQGITGWRGRRVPVKIGKHTCWYFPMFHPSFIARNRRFEPRRTDEYGCEDEFAFALDLERALAQIDTLPKPIVHTRDDVLGDTELIAGDNINRVLDFIESCYDYPYVGWDYETQRLRPYYKDARILSCALSHEHSTMAFALHHPQATWTDRELDQIKKALRALLYARSVRKIAHNLAFELEWTCHYYDRDVVHEGSWADTQSQAYILDERPMKGLLSLERLVIEHFGVDIKAIANVDVANLAETPITEVLRYNAPDAKYCRLLYEQQKQRLLNDGLQPIYVRHMRRVKAAVLTTVKGVPVDQKLNKDFELGLLKKQRKVEAAIADDPMIRKYEHDRKKTFRPSSPHDVKHLVGKVIYKLTDAQMKDMSVNKNVLEEVKEPIIKRILKFRDIAKQLSTYVLSVAAKPEPPHKPSDVVYPDGMLHPQYQTTRVVTWRTSSDDPNIQNWPTRKNREIRSQVRIDGKKVVSFDYAGMQARNVAMESRDKTLVKQFKERYDIHGDWTERTLRIYPAFFKEGVKVVAKDKDLFKAYRNRVKNEFVFPSLFGAHSSSLSGYMGIPQNVVERMHEEFYDQYPDVKKWQQGCWNFYRKHGYVTGCTGFRRHAPIERNQLINAPIQADEAMIVCDAWYRLSQRDIPYHPNLMVHDDLTFIWSNREIDKYVSDVVGDMLHTEHDWMRVVPLGVEMKIGDDWATQKAVDEFFSDTYKGTDPMKGSWIDGTGWTAVDISAKKDREGRR